MEKTPGDFLDLLDVVVQAPHEPRAPEFRGREKAAILSPSRSIMAALTSLEAATVAPLTGTANAR